MLGAVVVVVRRTVVVVVLGLGAAVVGAVVGLGVRTVVVVVGATAGVAAVTGVVGEGDVAGLGDAVGAAVVGRVVPGVRSVVVVVGGAGTVVDAVAATTVVGGASAAATVVDGSAGATPVAAAKPSPATGTTGTTVADATSFFAVLVVFEGAAASIHTTRPAAVVADIPTDTRRAPAAGKRRRDRDRVGFRGEEGVVCRAMRMKRAKRAIGTEWYRPPRSNALPHRQPGGYADPTARADPGL